MKYLDRVRLIMSKEEYEKEGFHKGDEGVIIFSWLRNEKFEVVFSRPMGEDDIEILVNLRDLELVRDTGVTDEDILEDCRRAIQIGGVR